MIILLQSEIILRKIKSGIQSSNSVIFLICNLKSRNTEIKMNST